MGDDPMMIQQFFEPLISGADDQVDSQYGDSGGSDP